MSAHVWYAQVGDSKPLVPFVIKYAHGGMDRADGAAPLLRVEALGDRCRSGDVGEEDGDEPPFFGGSRLRDRFRFESLDLQPEPGQGGLDHRVAECGALPFEHRDRVAELLESTARGLCHRFSTGSGTFRRQALPELDDGAVLRNVFEEGRAPLSIAYSPGQGHQLPISFL